MVLPRIFKFYFIFCVAILSTFGLSSFYRCFVCRHFIDIWFVVLLSTFGLFYRRGDVRRFIVTFYLCVSNSNRQNKFDQLNISNYSCQYVKELEL